MDSVKLVELLKNKNREAISKVYDQYAPVLYGLILRIVNSPAKAEFLLERTFLKVLKDIHTYKNSTTFFTWMIGIARTTVRENSVTDVPAASLGYEISQKDCIGLVEGMELQSMKVFCHLYFQGHSLLETSQALGISLEKVKIQLRSALGYIRTQIKIETERPVSD